MINTSGRENTDSQFFHGLSKKKQACKPDSVSHLVTFRSEASESE